MTTDSEEKLIRQVIDVLSRATEGHGNPRLDFASEDGHLGLLAQAVNGFLEHVEALQVHGRRSDDLPTGKLGYRDILNSLEESYFEVDLKGNLLFFNDRAVKDLGYSQQELRGMHFHNLVGPASAEIVYRAFHDVFLTGNPNKGFEWEILKKNNEPIEVESSVALLLDEKGAASGFHGIVRDISARKKAQRELREKEQKYADILANMEDTYLEADLAGNFTFFNDSLCRILGYSPEELQGASYRMIAPEGQVSEMYRAYHEIYRTGQSKAFLEQELLAKDGTTIYLESFISLLRSPAGEPIGFNGFGRDVTERVRGRRKLEESERKLRLMTENVHDMIWAMDFNFRFTYLSPSVFALTGFTPEEVMTIPLQMIVPADRYAWVEQILAEELARDAEGAFPEDRRFVHEIPLFRKDGSVLWAEVNVTFNRDEKGVPFEIVGVTRDISERKKAERELRKSEERYRMIAEKMTDIVWLADMDLRLLYVTPSIQSVLGFSAEERLGMTVDQQFTPESLSVGLAALARELTLEEEGNRDPKRTVSLVLEYNHKDGSTRWMDTIISGVRDDRGVLTGLYGVSRDITDRKKAEDALRESEQRHRLIVENVNDILWTIGLDLKFIYVSPSNHRVSGFSRDEVMAMTLADILSPQSFELATRALSEELAIENSGKSVDPNRSRTLELELLHKQGGTIWLEISATFNRDTQGRPTEILAVGSDVTDRKEMERQLAENEMRYRMIVENIQDSISVIDLDLNYLYQSPSEIRLTGYNPEEVMAMSIQDQMTPESYRLAEQIMAEELALEFSGNALDTDRSRTFELEVYHKDGGTIWQETTASFQRDDEGKPIGVILTSRDVTARKRAEQRLRESEEKYRTILESMEDGYWETDLKGRYTFTNDALCRIMARSREELIGMNNRVYADPAVADRTFGIFNRVYRTGTPATVVDYRFQRGDGAMVTHELSVSLRRDSRGNPVGFRGISRDVTERREMEKALAENEERYRMIVENIHGSVLVLDLDLNYLYVSPSEITMSGYRPEELVAIPVEDQMTAESYQRLAGLLTEELDLEHSGRPADPSRSRTIEIETYHKQGGMVWQELTATFQRDGEGNPRGIIVTTKDITARKRAEEEKEKLESQLLQAQKMETVGRLAGGVAHDFNNMLSVILGYVDLAKLRLVKEHPVLKDIVEIEKAAIKSRNITAQLLAFSRKQIIVPAVVNLNTLITHSKEALIRLIGEDIELKDSLEKNLWMVKFDPSQVEQILVNLAVNARDAMPTGGSLVIETKNVVIDEFYCRDHLYFTPGSYVCLTVSDNGAGMDKATLEHIFEPFFTTKEVGKGTGLGMATVYGIVKQNKGFINVYSEPGYGTTFTIYVPRTTEEMTVQEEPEDQGESIGAGNILLVEDDPMVLEITKGLLESIGYDVIAAGNPREALTVYENHGRPIRLVITDVVMPDMSGKELIDRLNAIRPCEGVLFMSGYTADAIARHGVLDRGVNFLQKPFRLRELARKVREIMMVN